MTLTLTLSLSLSLSLTLTLTLTLTRTLTQEPFLKLLSLFEGEAAKNNNKMIMDAVSKMPGSYSDPLLLNNLMHVARQLHDSLDYLSFEDERRQP